MKKPYEIPNLEGLHELFVRNNNLDEINQAYELIFASVLSPVTMPEILGPQSYAWQNTLSDLLKCKVEFELINQEKTYCREARLEMLSTSPKVLLTDFKGVDSDRYAFEVYMKFAFSAEAKRGKMICTWETGVTPTRASVIAACKETVFRYFYQAEHGLPKTLGGMLRQEGLAQAYAGRKVNLAREDIEGIDTIIRDYLDSEYYRHQFSCLFGDRIAAQLDYPPLGLPHRAGFELALFKALETGVDPLMYNANQQAISLVS